VHVVIGSIETTKGDYSDLPLNDETSLGLGANLKGERPVTTALQFHDQMNIEVIRMAAGTSPDLADSTARTNGVLEGGA
jgi:hypothetical protein